MTRPTDPAPEPRDAVSDDAGAADGPRTAESGSGAAGSSSDVPTAAELRSPEWRTGSRLRRHPPLHTIGSDPDYRYSLANERTFLSWIRTALALIAAGVAVVQLAPDLGPRGLRLAVGTALIVVGGFLAAASHHRWITRERAMRLGTTLPRNRLAILLGYSLAAIAVAVLVVLLISEPR